MHAHAQTTNMSVQDQYHYYMLEGVYLVMERVGTHTYCKHTPTHKDIKAWSLVIIRGHSSDSWHRAYHWAAAGGGGSNIKQALLSEFGEC